MCFFPVNMQSPPREGFFSLNHPTPLETSFYNFGQNKIKKNTPPPESMLNSLYNKNAPFFSTIEMGEGVD